MTNRGRRARLEDIQRVADALREPVDAPDFSSAILARVDSQRCFLSSRSRMLVWIGRGAAALTVALMVLGFTLAQRYSPGTLELVEQPRPVSDVIAVVSTQANEQLTALRFSLAPSNGNSLELTSLLATMAPANELAEPLGAAIQAVRFVGPPEMQGYGEVIVGETGGVGAARAMRLPRAGKSVWPPEGLREAMEDRHWLEDESPLLSGEGVGASIAPK